jgi:rsbT co-antagonist protein RsbR
MQRQTSRPLEAAPMHQAETSTLAALLRQHEPEILAGWLRHQSEITRKLGDDTQSPDLARDFLRRLRAALETAAQTGAVADLTVPAWNDVRDWLSDFSRTRARQGYTASETAVFVFSLKHALFEQLRAFTQDDPVRLAEEVWRATLVLDALGLYTTEVHQKGREEVIAQQQQEMLELSTPVVQLWEGILALPLIGTLDSARTQVVMENLLQRIVETSAEIAIIDITGVPTVDTLVAQHLLKTVAAARLMGADCMISGIRPQIAQTIVHLGVELGAVSTKATLADAFALALKRSGRVVSRAQAPPPDGR